MHDPIKVYDARWEAHEFTDSEVTRLFEATFLYGRELGVDTISFVRDTRLAGGHVLELGIHEALRQGMRVAVRAAPSSTPYSYFQTLRLSERYPRTMGLTITASHNPAQYVGVKFTVPTVQAIGLDCGPRGGLTRVRQNYHGRRRAAPRGGGRLNFLDLSGEFIATSMKQAGVSAGSLKGLKVVLDAFHGSAGADHHSALRRAGATIHAMRIIPDGHFPTGSPNPTSQGKMDAAVAWCRKNRFDVVVGLDGDGDRMVFGDRRGILSAGFVAIPILKAAGIASLRKPAPVLYDPKVSPLALAEWGKLGVRPMLFRNGHSQIKDYMQQIGAPAAAEESGHYYHRITLGNLTVSTENSLLTVLLFLSAVKRQPRLLDRLWALQRRIYTTGEFNYQFKSDAVRDRAMAAVIAHFTADGASSVTATPDGIDLEGTCLSRGVDLRPGQANLSPGWYSGYLRVATNEKGVVRSYFSAGDGRAGERVELATRQILGRDFKGVVVE